MVDVYCRMADCHPTLYHPLLGGLIKFPQHIALVGQRFFAVKLVFPLGNALAVLVIAKWEHKFDRKKALAYERDVLGKFDKTAQ